MNLPGNQTRFNNYLNTSIFSSVGDILKIDPNLLAMFSEFESNIVGCIPSGIFFGKPKKNLGNVLDICPPQIPFGTVTLFWCDFIKNEIQKWRQKQVKIWFYVSSEYFYKVTLRCNHGTVFFTLHLQLLYVSNSKMVVFLFRYS